MKYHEILNELSTRARNALLTSGIMNQVNELKDFEKIPYSRLMRARDIGRKTATEIEQALNKRGVHPNWGLLHEAIEKNHRLNRIPDGFSDIEDPRLLSPIANVFIRNHITTWEELSKLPFSSLSGVRGMGVKMIKTLEVFLNKRNLFPKWKDEFWESL